ncbi:MAG: hypothetical protein RSD67_01470 [Oscillospiraceae bacterium]
MRNRGLALALAIIALSMTACGKDENSSDNAADSSSIPFKQDGL